MLEPRKLAKEPRERLMEAIRKELMALEKRELEIKAMERKERQMQLARLQPTPPLAPRSSNGSMTAP